MRSTFNHTSIVARDEHHFCALPTTKWYDCLVDGILLLIFVFPVTTVAQDQLTESPQSSHAAESVPNQAVVFILDCSQSMADLQPSPLGPVSTFTVAKHSFVEVLQPLARRNEAGMGPYTLVGVRFFGHRAGWGIDAVPPRIRLQKTYTGVIPLDLSPSLDVELIKALGRFGQGEFQSVAKQLESVKPWGESPLFLSLEQSLADFENVPRGVEKSIIAITNGRDEQFRPTKFLPEVLNAWQRKREIEIHILGFNIPQHQAAIARREHIRLANATDGSYSEIRSGRELSKQLEEILNLDGN